MSKYKTGAEYPDLPHPRSMSAAEYRARQTATPTQSYQALGRLKSGTMNKTEAKYAALLEERKIAGDVLWYAFEPASLRLGEKCFYRVDFLVMTSSGLLEAHEIKGMWTDDAKVKIRVAAEKFPFRFVAVQHIKGQWKYTNF